MKKQKKIILKILILILIVLFLIFISIKNKPINYFDLTDQNNTYIITSDSNYFWIQPSNKDIKMIIYSSPKDLSNFLNKEIHITGKFIFTTFNKVLCPQVNCSHSNGKLEAVEIINIF